uniref:Prepilin leader peptidase/N-methyltransferase n=1 Tax=Magnetococcus massalia (strain MO-1) TaxID=451514 RepID=A0A1S7LNC5_MAGMO|nr:Type 4 prepilin-like proteins leader peptide-processing enzyme [Includes: Leader peptidase; N-methyltransferase] [Candidatus Magnetococcus massalia]
MASLEISFGLLFGLIFGSFTNVCVHRIPRQESIAFPPSHCPKCKHSIAWYHNIPLFGWLWLRGRCAHCQVKISIRYPIMELLGGLIAAIGVGLFGLTYEGALVALFGLTLLTLSAIDLEHMILPDRITYPGIILGLLINLFPLGEPFPVFWDALLGVVGGGGGLWLLIVVYQKITGRLAMGLGDVKLLAMFGAWLGWQPLFPLLFLASVMGVIVGGGWLMLAKKGGASPIPFGPFLAFSGWLHLLWGDAWLLWIRQWILVG